MSLDNNQGECYIHSVETRTFVLHTVTSEVCRKKDALSLPKEQNSQAFPLGNEDCKRMWLWRSPLRGDAEGAMRGYGCVNLSGKRTEYGCGERHPFGEGGLRVSFRSRFAPMAHRLFYLAGI